MNQEEISKKLKVERKNLESFLNERRLNAETLPQVMGDKFDAFLNILSQISSSMEKAETIAKQTKNIDNVAFLAAQARLLKDDAYSVMLQVFGFNLISGGYGDALRDYVMLKYDNGLREVEVALAI